MFILTWFSTICRSFLSCQYCQWFCGNTSMCASFCQVELFLENCLKINQVTKSNISTLYEHTVVWLNPSTINTNEVAQIVCLNNKRNALKEIIGSSLEAGTQHLNSLLQAWMNSKPFFLPQASAVRCHLSSMYFHRQQVHVPRYVCLAWCHYRPSSSVWFTPKKWNIFLYYYKGLSSKDQHWDTYMYTWAAILRYLRAFTIETKYQTKAKLCSGKLFAIEQYIVDVCLYVCSCLLAEGKLSHHGRTCRFVHLFIKSQDSGEYYSANTHRCMGTQPKLIILYPRCKFNISYTLKLTDDRLLVW